ncbi:hypothetical protein EI94DRAFT_1715186 [Lactarius quietus]|nr:hypothetical protein EI94DRAFT_1715186 [Lactarius quietus]
MPREVPTYRAQFSAVKVLRYRCNICTGNKRLTLRRKQAISHGGSAKHCSKAESEAFFGRPGNFTTLRVTNWLCKTCKDRCGRPMMIMTCEEAKLHEVSRKHYPKVAATFFKHPESEPYL